MTKDERVRRADEIREASAPLIKSLEHTLSQVSQMVQDFNPTRAEDVLATLSDHDFDIHAFKNRIRRPLNALIEEEYRI